MLRRFLTIFLPAAILVGIFLGLLYFSEARTTRLLIETKESDTLDLQFETISTEFNSIISDLFVIADSHEYSEIYHHTDDRFMDIASHFLSFSREKRIYDQIRLIGLDGFEEIRVNFNGGSPLVVPVSGLGDKSEMYYVKRSLALRRGEVFISPLELNVEGGRVEEPHKTTIRFATPVLDLAGKRRGIVVLDYFASRLTEHIESVASGAKGETSFLDSEGSWLFSSGGGDGKRLIFEGDRSFKEHYPEEWKKVSKVDSGRFYAPSGLFIFRTLYPLLHAQERLLSNMVPDRKVSQIEDRSYYWKFVSRVPPEVLDGASRKFFYRLLLIYAGIMAVIAVGAWYMAVDHIGREWAKHALEESEERFREIRTSSFDGIVVANVEGLITEVNSVAEGLLGYGQSELLGRELTVLIPEKYRSGHTEGFKRFLTTGEPRAQGNVIQLPGLTKDGRDIALDMIINNFMIGGEIYFIASFRTASKV